MTTLNDAALDAALQYIRDNGTVLHLCSAEPASYAGVAAVELGTKTGIAVGAQAAGDVSGRKVTVPAVSDGAVSADGTATHWALTNGANLLVATGALSASQVLTNGNQFQTPAFDLELPDPA